MAQADSSRYPAGQRQIGVNDFQLGWQAVVNTDAPPYELLRVGGRVGVYLADGWVVGVGATRTISYPEWPQPQALRWTYVGGYTRYYLTHREKWSPFGELGLGYTVIQHDDPQETLGVGPLMQPRIGVSFRINHTWSIDVGAQYPLPLRGASGPQLAFGSILKGGLWLHWP